MSSRPQKPTSNQPRKARHVPPSPEVPVRRVTSSRNQPFGSSSTQRSSDTTSIRPVQRALRLPDPSSSPLECVAKTPPSSTGEQAAPRAPATDSVTQTSDTHSQSRGQTLGSILADYRKDSVNHAISNGCGLSFSSRRRRPFSHALKLREPRKLRAGSFAECTRQFDAYYADAEHRSVLVGELARSVSLQTIINDSEFLSSIVMNPRWLRVSVRRYPEFERAYLGHEETVSAVQDGMPLVGEEHSARGDWDTFTSPAAATCGQASPGHSRPPANDTIAGGGSVMDPYLIDSDEESQDDLGQSTYGRTGRPGNSDAIALALVPGTAELDSGVSDGMLPQADSSVSEAPAATLDESALPVRDENTEPCWEAVWGAGQLDSGVSESMLPQADSSVNLAPAATLDQLALPVGDENIEPDWEANWGGGGNEDLMQWLFGDPWAYSPEQEQAEGV